MEATRRARPALTGVVLAGGRSRRMGRDKALLEWHGRALVDHVAARIAPVCAEVLIASGDGRRLGRPGEIADALPGSGPLAGLLAALDAARTPLVAAVAVDMPYADARVLLALARALEQGPADLPGLVPVAGGWPQPLHAVYRSAAAPRLRALLDRGGPTVLGIVRALGVAEADPEVWRAADPEERFALNLNRPDDLP